MSVVKAKRKKKDDRNPLDPFERGTTIPRLAV
jgi:hypothetical protein